MWQAAASTILNKAGKTLTATVTCGLILAAICATALLPAVGRTGAIRTVMAASYQSATSPWKVMLSAGEAEFIRKAARKLPAGAVILGVPTNGSAYFWALTGHDVVYPTLRKYSDADRLYIARNAADVLYDPQVCQALDRLGAYYLYTDSDTTGGGAPGGGETPRFATTIDSIPEQALEVVAQEKTWTLWRISYCAPTDSPKDISTPQGTGADSAGSEVQP